MPAASTFHERAAPGQAACDREAFNPLSNGRRCFNYLRLQRKHWSHQTLCWLGSQPGPGPALWGQATALCLLRRWPALGAACGCSASQVASSKAQ